MAMKSLHRYTSFFIRTMFLSQLRCDLFITFDSIKKFFQLNNIHWKLVSYFFLLDDRFIAQIMLDDTRWLTEMYPGVGFSYIFFYLGLIIVIFSSLDSYFLNK